MKVAIVSDRIYPYFKGGGEKRYWNLAQQLVKDGHEVHFFTGQWPGMSKRMIIEDISVTGVYRVKNFYVNGRKSTLESIKYSLALLPYLLRADFDVIDCEQMPILSIFPSKLASLIKRRPLVVTWYEAWGKTYWTNYMGRLGVVAHSIEKLALRLPPAIISVSSNTTKGLGEMYKIKSQRISTIHCGIDAETIASAHPSHTTSDLIFVGRLLAHKQVDLLLEVLALLKQKTSTVSCIIVGGGPEEARLKALVKKLKLETNVQFVGELPEASDVYGLIKSSKVLVQPSMREGFGIVAVEANACGKPVVTINVPTNAAKDLIEEGVNGYVCNPSPQDFATSIAVALKNHAKLEQSCIASARRYDWRELAPRAVEVYAL